jgi:transcriptional regulator with XRE-family HTH domain
MKSSAKPSPDAGTLSQSAIDFADRLKTAIAGRNASAIARDVGIAGSTLHRYLSGSMPAADIAFKLARALEVRPEWLIEASGGMRGEAGPKQDGGDFVLIDRYDALAFSELGKGEPVEEITIPRWLLSSVKQSNGVWLCEMPSDALPSVAAEGELVVCRDAEAPLQDRRVYIFLFDGRPVVRRVILRPDGLQLAGETDDTTINIRAEDAEQLVPVARVLAAISLHQV